MSVSPLRFGNLIKLENPSVQTVNQIIDRHQRLGVETFYITEHETPPLGRVTLLTGEDAVITIGATEMIQEYEHDLTKAHGPQKGLVLRFMRQVCNHTQATNLDQLLQWYYKTPSKDILAVHQKLSHWIARFQPQHEAATQARHNRQSALAHLESVFKRPGLSHSFQNPNTVFLVSGNRTKH